MTTSRWFSSLIQTNPDLYRAIYDWNTYPHRWVRADWLSDLPAPAPVLALLENSPTGRARLGAHYRRSLGLEACLWDFQSPSRRLALLGADTLGRLANFAGATLHWARLARVVSKDERRAIIEVIGEDAYSFAMRRGRFLVGPDGLDALGFQGGSLADDIRRSGWQSLSTCLATEPQALQQRFRLKSPKDLSLQPLIGSEDSATHAWNFIQQITKEILSTQEAKCFA